MLLLTVMVAQFDCWEEYPPLALSCGFCVTVYDPLDGKKVDRGNKAAVQPMVNCMVMPVQLPATQVE